MDFATALVPDVDVLDVGRLVMVAAAWQSSWWNEVLGQWGDGIVVIVIDVESALE